MKNTKIKNNMILQTTCTKTITGKHKWEEIEPKLQCKFCGMINDLQVPGQDYPVGH